MVENEKYILMDVKTLVLTDLRNMMDSYTFQASAM